MAKYTPLHDFLLQNGGSSLRLSFSEIENILGAQLPRSAHKYQPWWANENSGQHVQAQAWMDAGYIVDNVNFTQQYVVFKKD